MLASAFADKVLTQFERYLKGESVNVLAKEDGVTRQAIDYRFRKTIRQLFARWKRTPEPKMPYPGPLRTSGHRMLSLPTITQTLLHKEFWLSEIIAYRNWLQSLGDLRAKKLKLS